MPPLLRTLFLALAVFLVGSSFARVAWADKVVVLPFASSTGVSKPELDEVRRWTEKAVAQQKHALPSPSETLSAEMAIRDGVADTSEEYRAAGRASGAAWTLTGRVERIDVPPAKGSDGVELDGYTLFRVEVEAGFVESGRVESLAREIDPDVAPDQLAEMLAILLRPEGIARAEIPWEREGRRKGKPKKKEEPRPAPAPVPPPVASPPPPRSVYAEGHPFAIGGSIGLSTTLSQPSVARGPSLALPIGVAGAYALEALPGLELRGIFTSQVVGPRALEFAGGARYAIAVARTARLFVGPEVLLGTHVAIGAEKTARFLAHGAAFVALGLGEQLQLELAGDLAAAFGGSGTLVLGGGTTRVLVRF